MGIVFILLYCLPTLSENDRTVSLDKVYNQYFQVNFFGKNKEEDGTELIMM